MGKDTDLLSEKGRAIRNLTDEVLTLHVRLDGIKNQTVVSQTDMNGIRMYVKDVEKAIIKFWNVDGFSLCECPDNIHTSRCHTCDCPSYSNEYLGNGASSGSCDNCAHSETQHWPECTTEQLARKMWEVIGRGKA